VNDEIKELMVEDEFFNQPSTDEMKYQLPVKLLDAAEKISRKVMELKKDEFGDLFLDTSENTKDNQELKQASEIMEYWINKLLKPNNTKLGSSIFDKKVSTSNQEVQVQFDDFFESYHREVNFLLIFLEFER